MQISSAPKFPLYSLQSSGYFARMNQKEQMDRMNDVLVEQMEELLSLFEHMESYFLSVFYVREWSFITGSWGWEISARVPEKTSTPPSR